MSEERRGDGVPPLAEHARTEALEVHLRVGAPADRTLERIVRRAPRDYDSIIEAVEGAAFSQAILLAPRRVVPKHMRRVNRSHALRFARDLSQKMGIPWNEIWAREHVRSWMDAQIARNVSRIRSIPDDRKRALANRLRKLASRESFDEASIRKAVTGSARSSTRRADLLVRDQATKQNAALSEIRQHAAGIDRYAWSTMRDERVRDSHEVKEGAIYYWDNPPTDTGHPGNDILCRCVARPVVTVP